MFGPPSLGGSGTGPRHGVFPTQEPHPSKIPQGCPDLSLGRAPSLGNAGIKPQNLSSPQSLIGQASIPLHDREVLSATHSAVSRLACDTLGQGAPPSWCSGGLRACMAAPPSKGRSLMCQGSHEKARVGKARPEQIVLGDQRQTAVDESKCGFNFVGPQYKTKEDRQRLEEEDQSIG